MVEFNLRHFNDYYDKVHPLCITEGIIYRPLFIKWIFDSTEYIIEKTDNELILYVYVSQNTIVILYADGFSSHPHPNNLVMYNLRQEVIGIIPPPKLMTTKSDLPITGIDNVIDIDGKQYLQVCINYGDVKAVLETHFFNIQKREYHSSKVEVLHFSNYR